MAAPRLTPEEIRELKALSRQRALELEHRLGIKLKNPSTIFERFLRSTKPCQFEQLIAAIKGATVWRCTNCLYHQTVYGPCAQCGAVAFERLLDDDK